MHRSLERAKADLLDVRRTLDDLIERLPRDVWARPSPDPGWSYEDLLAHLASGDWVCQTVLRAAQEGRDPSEVARGLDLDGTNARLVEERRPRSVAELRRELSEHRQLTFELMDRLEERHLALPDPWRPNSRLLDYLNRFHHHELIHQRELSEAEVA